VPAPSSPRLSGQNLFCPLVLWFCWRENIADNKKDTAFLLVWDKDSYTERFLVLLPCTCVLKPTLIHLYQTPSRLPCPLPIIGLCQFKITLSAHQGAHQPLSSFGFPTFPYSSCVCSPLVCGPCPIILLQFFLSIICIWGRTEFLAFWAWLG
jgi:hypothetical protein